MKATIDLTASDINSAIKNWVRKETGKEVKEVTLHINEILKGYGMNEYTDYQVSATASLY